MSNTMASLPITEMRLKVYKSPIRIGGASTRVQESKDTSLNVSPGHCVVIPTKAKRSSLWQLAGLAIVLSGGGDIMQSSLGLSP